MLHCETLMEFVTQFLFRELPYLAYHYSSNQHLAFKWEYFLYKILPKKYCKHCCDSALTLILFPSIISLTVLTAIRASKLSTQLRTKFTAFPSLLPLLKYNNKEKHKYTCTNFNFTAMKIKIQLDWKWVKLLCALLEDWNAQLIKLEAGGIYMLVF